MKLAQSSGTNVATLLGHVIAHDLGHLFLPHGSHALTGLMTGRWDVLQLELAKTGELTFTRRSRKGHPEQIGERPVVPRRPRSVAAA